MKIIMSIQITVFNNRVKFNNLYPFIRVVIILDNRIMSNFTSYKKVYIE